MSKAKMTISIDRELAAYLRSTSSVSSTIAEAVELYRARRLEEELEAAYREDAAEAAEIDSQWRVADAEVGD